MKTKNKKTNNKTFNISMWPWDKKEKPFFTSKEYEWYIHNSLTKYAHSTNSNGISLPNIIAFIVRKMPDVKVESYVLMDKKNNSVIYDSSSLEGIGAKIDILKVMKHFDEKGEKTKDGNII